MEQLTVGRWARERLGRGNAMRNRIVARYLEGRVLKGFTVDFMAGKEIFHITEASSTSGKPVKVLVSELKAVFFVKDLVGNPAYTDRKVFDPSRPVAGRKIEVQFRDGEQIVGTTTGYQPGRTGFFLIPADPLSNNERVYVVSSATQEIRFL
jgi:hypothetical protein